MIKIEEVQFRDSAGTPFVYEGVHSGSELAGLSMDVTAYTEDDVSLVEELIEKQTVAVEDPYAARLYQATLTRRSSSYTQGWTERRYHFEVKELDEVQAFEVLEIEGQPFQVLRNTESVDGDAIGLHVLLRLSQDEFEKFQGLVKPGPIQLRRVGIDDSSIVRRFGSALYWSSHQENSQTFYKQIARFYPEDLSSRGGNIAAGQGQRALSRMVLSLSARYEGLLKLLVDNGQLSRESAETLMAEEWRGLIDDPRRVLLASKLTEVDDADAELD